MKRLISSLSAIAAIITGSFFSACNKDYHNNPDKPPQVNAVVLAAAGDSAAIAIKLNAFRTLTGDPLNTAPGASLGRREINWDAVPANFTNANNFPADFFGASDPALPNARKRGLILGTTGGGFRVDSTKFAEIDNSYAGQFTIFSQKRLFAPVGGTVTQINFKVPGSTNNAFVKSFGVIFFDVDDASSTYIEYYNGTKSLGIYKALPSAQGFSFLGVQFPDEKITAVKITSGSGTLAAGVKDISNGGTKDLVVMDDFIYDEPKPL